MLGYCTKSVARRRAEVREQVLSVRRSLAQISAQKVVMQLSAMDKLDGMRRSSEKPALLQGPGWSPICLSRFLNIHIWVFRKF